MADKKTTWGVDEIEGLLEAYPGMTELYLELSRRISSPNYTEPTLIGPDTFALSNPEGTSMTPGSPDFFGAREMMLLQQILGVATGGGSNFLFTIPEDLEAFDKTCTQELARLQKNGVLH